MGYGKDVGNMRNRKGLVLIIVLLLGVGGWFYHQHLQTMEMTAAHELKLSGNVDVREISLAFRQSDRIAELLADAGDTVKQGQVLARLDTHELQLARNEAAAKLAAQQSSVDKLYHGSRSEEIQQAQEGGVPRDHLQVGIEHRDALVEQIQPGAQHLLVTPLGAGGNAAFRLAGRFVVPVHRRSAET